MTRKRNLQVLVLTESLRLYIVWRIEVLENLAIGQKSILKPWHGTLTKHNIEKTYQKAIQISHPLITMIITLFFYRLTPPLTHQKKMWKKMTKKKTRKTRKKMIKKMRKKLTRILNLKIHSFQRNLYHHMRISKVMEIIKLSKSFFIMALLAQDHKIVTIGMVCKRDSTNYQTTISTNRKHHPAIRFHLQLQRRKLDTFN